MFGPFVETTISHGTSLVPWIFTLCSEESWGFCRWALGTTGRKRTLELALPFQRAAPLSSAHILGIYSEHDFIEKKKRLLLPNKGFENSCFKMHVEKSYIMILCQRQYNRKCVCVCGKKGMLWLQGFQN